MKKLKAKKLIRTVAELTRNYDPKALKAAIGDSTENHRVPTVSQVIRFLTRRNASANQRTLGKQLKQAYLSNRVNIKKTVRSHTNRTDALDINEFVRGYNIVVHYPQIFNSRLQSL